MLINEKKTIKEGKLDILPFGRKMSKLFGLVKHEPGVTYVVDFGGNGKIEIEFDREPDLPEEKKKRLLDEMFKNIKLYGDQGEKELEFKGYKIKYNKQTEKWTKDETKRSFLNKLLNQLKSWINN